MTPDRSHEPLPDVDFRALFSTLPTPYVVMTPELIVVAANAAYLASTGRQLQDLVGVGVFVSFPETTDLDEQGRSPIHRSMDRVVLTGLAETMPVQRYPIASPDGTMSQRKWLVIHVPVLDPAGRVVLLVQRAEDITDFAVEREQAAANLGIGNPRAEHADANPLIDDEGGPRDETAWRQRVEQVEADLFSRARELSEALAAKDEVARQLASLAEVALTLASAQSVQEVEQIVVRGLTVLDADGGAIVAAASDGGWRITIGDELGKDVQRLFGHVGYDSPLPGPTTARTGRRLLLPSRASGLDFDPSMADVYAETQRSGWAFLPLVVEGTCRGCLAVSWVNEHRFTPAELGVLDGFAAQCAQALHRVELIEAGRAAAEQRQRLSEALQHALLTPPPQPDGLRIDVRYRAASQDAQIGGDWYDAFVQPDGATMLAIGDVIGHDNKAAAKMGQLRGLIRAVSYNPDPDAAYDSPATALRHAEQTAQGLDVDTIATAVLARLEPRSGSADQGRRLTWSNAGHPPPLLLRADGHVEYLEPKSDLLLGVDPSRARHDHEMMMPAGSTLLLYTDGLIEKRGASLHDGLEALRAAAVELAHQPLPDLIDGILARLAPEAGDDDIAMIAVRS